jgi:hypothetical protein
LVEGAAGQGVEAIVVRLALARVRQHLVGLGDLLEPLLGLRIGVHVRVKLPREPPVGPLDFVLRRVPADLEQGIVVLRH